MSLFPGPTRLRLPWKIYISTYKLEVFPGVHLHKRSRTASQLLRVGKFRHENCGDGSCGQRKIKRANFGVTSSRILIVAEIGLRTFGTLPRPPHVRVMWRMLAQACHLQDGHNPYEYSSRTAVSTQGRTSVPEAAHEGMSATAVWRM